MFATEFHEPAWVLIVLGLLTLAGVVLPSLIAGAAARHAKVAATQATEANDAVNHKHPGQDRLFDMVLTTRENLADLTISNTEQHEAIVAAAITAVTMARTAEQTAIIARDTISAKLEEHLSQIACRKQPEVK